MDFMIITQAGVPVRFEQTANSPRHSVHNLTELFDLRWTDLYNEIFRSYMWILHGASSNSMRESTGVDVA
jgi:hypothetical protein